MYPVPTSRGAASARCPMFPPLLLGEYLHVISDAGIYTCFDPKTGATLHSGRKLGSVYSSPVAVANRIYFFEDSGKCTIVENGSQFKVITVNDLNELVQTTPAISDGRLFVRTDTHLMCIGSERNTVAAAANPVDGSVEGP